MDVISYCTGNIHFFNLFPIMKSYKNIDKVMKSKVVSLVNKYFLENNVWDLPIIFMKSEGNVG